MSFASSKGLVFQGLILTDKGNAIHFFTSEASPPPDFLPHQESFTLYLWVEQCFREVFLSQNRRPSTHLWNPESAADVHPLGAAPGGFHGAAFLGAQEALGLQAQRAGPAQPAALGHLQDPVARLLHGHQGTENKANTMLFLSSLHTASHSSQS